jgi:hypothetical protein
MAASALTESERTKRVLLMKEFGVWLKTEKQTQKWAGAQLGIYPGYVSNLVTGKQTASEDVCRKAEGLMGPVKPKDTTIRDVPIKRRVVKKKVAKLRTTPAKPEELPFDSTHVVEVPRAITQLPQRPKPTPEPVVKPPKVEPSPRARHRRRRSPTPVEAKAACDVTCAWIKSMAQEDVTPDQVVEVIEGLVDAFTQ